MPGQNRGRLDAETVKARLQQLDVGRNPQSAVKRGKHVLLEVWAAERSLWGLSWVGKRAVQVAVGPRWWVGGVRCQGIPVG